MRPITRDDVIRILGELDDLAVAQIVASGASVAELEEAVAELEFDVEVGGRRIEPSSPRVRELNALVSELLADELSGDEVDE